MHNREPHEVSSSRSRWYACYTRARHEKRVVQRLSAEDLQVFLPTIPKVREWHDRTATIEFPLFPGYLFVRTARERLPHVVSTPGVVNIVKFNGEPAPVREDEIENVRCLVDRLGESGIDAGTGPYRPETGQRVRVTEGPLEGVIGKVAEHRGSDRVLVVGVGAIGHGVRVEVHVGMVETIKQVRDMAAAGAGVR